MLEISAVIITYNEEHNIERCLQSLLNVADEIIVVDSFSTDLTEDICKEYGVYFFQNKWLGYGAQKNYGNDKARYPFILSIDADEVLSPELIISIQNIKKNGTADAYSFNRLTNYFNRKWIRHCGWYPDEKIRLWRKDAAQWNLAEVHEELELSPQVSIEHLHGDLLHYTYQNIEDHIRTADKYTTLVAQKYFMANKKTNVVIMIFKAWFSFIRDYFFKLGILDGYEGFLICSINSMFTFLKYVKLKELYRKK